MNGTLHTSSSASAANGSRNSAGTSPATVAGGTPTGNDGQPRRRKPRPSSGPLRAPRRPLKTITRPLMAYTQMNKTNMPEVAPSNHSSGPVEVEALRNEFLAKGARSYPLVVTRKDLKDLRHHVMRLQAKERINVQNEEEFTPPIRLHRRDPRAPLNGAGAQFEEEEDNKEDLEESKERERMEILREERRKIREENQAKIAPSGTKKPPAFQKKTEQKYRPDDTPEAKKRQLLRYEETLPWHLEDFDNKQTWTGTYESELSEAHVMLTADVHNEQGQVIQLAPLERWYRFNIRTKAKSTEDPELVKEKTSVYFQNLEKKARVKKEQVERDKGAKGMRTRVGGGDDDEGRIRRLFEDDDMPVVKREADADDIDFNMEEDFADDEEGLNGLFEGDEVEVKEASERLKRDQLAAAAFDLRDENEIYRQDEREAQEKEMLRVLEKAMRKTLVKREKNIDYQTDEENPYASSSESETDSETERQRAKVEEERKAAEQNGKTLPTDKPASEASTKGANTPIPPPRSDVSKKRPGSPNLSEASGNESSRKKHKKKHGTNHEGIRRSGLVHLPRGPGSGSDSEMTDSGRPKRPKLSAKVNGGSPGASPMSSRAGSPSALSGSRASSPAAASASSPQSRLPSASEIYKALPAEGTTISVLIARFKNRVDTTNSGHFIRLVKAVSSFDKQRSWLTPLPQLPSEEQIQAVLTTKPTAPAK